VSPSLSLTFPIQATQAGDVRPQDECQQGTHTRTQRMAQKGDAVACRIDNAYIPGTAVEGGAENS